jgi:hypothetical protein
VVSKTRGSFGKWGEFPKPVPVSKTGGGFQNQGEFWKVEGVSKTGTSFQNRYQFPKPTAVSKTEVAKISEIISRPNGWNGIQEAHAITSC